MSTKLSLKEALERQAEWQDASLEPSVSRTPNVWIKPLHIPNTIAVAKAMMTFGVRLKDAHDAINRLAARETIAVAIPGDVDVIVATLEPLGVSVAAYVGTPGLASHDA